jgi:hypothetical protein
MGADAPIPPRMRGSRRPEGRCPAAASITLLFDSLGDFVYIKTGIHRHRNAGVPPSRWQSPSVSSESERFVRTLRRRRFSTGKSWNHEDEKNSSEFFESKEERPRMSGFFYLSNIQKTFLVIYCGLY